jgi:hypothetical protein
VGSLLPLGVTVKVYGVPMVRARNEHVWAPDGAVPVFATVQVLVPGVEVTV